MKMTPMQIEISYLTEADVDADLDAVVDLFEQYRSFYGKAPTPDARAFLVERVASGQSLVLVARDGVRVVGFTQVYRAFSSIRLTHDWVLSDLFVDGSARGRRVGGGLVDAVVAAARENGAHHVVLETEENNAYARRLYESRGFESDGRAGGFLRYALQLHHHH